MGFCFFNNVAVAAAWLQTVYDGTSLDPPPPPPTSLDKENENEVSESVGSGENTLRAIPEREGVMIKKVLILDWSVLF